MKKKPLCDKCGSQNLKAQLVTYPMQMDEKQITIGRVSVRKCLDCNHLIPTEKGQEKITRCMINMMDIMMLHG